MKKTITVLTALLLALALAGTGCRSRLKEGIEQDKKRYVVDELDPEKCYSEEDGYHYPGVPWGTHVGGLQEAIGVSVSKVSGYGENNVIFYEAQQLRGKIMGRTSDGSSVGCVGDTIYLISLVFDSSSSEVAGISQSDLRSQYLEKLKAAFGEPDDYQQTQKVISEITNYYDIWYWDAETPDGKKTQFQLASSATLPGGEPAYISVGVVWLRDDVITQDGEDAEEE